MSNRLSFTNYDFSKRASAIFDMLKDILPYQKVYPEYSYHRILSRYYKLKGIDPSVWNRHLLSQTKLRADFFIPDFNVVIEVDGEQHYKPVRFGGITSDQARCILAEQRHRDSLKNRICTESECRLVRIKFDQEINKDTLLELIRERG